MKSLTLLALALVSIHAQAATPTSLDKVNCTIDKTVVVQNSSGMGVEDDVTTSRSIKMDGNVDHTFGAVKIAGESFNLKADRWYDTKGEYIAITLGVTTAKHVISFEGRTTVSIAIGDQTTLTCGL